jgi:hypothetical protein
MQVAATKRTDVSIKRIRLADGETSQARLAYPGASVLWCWGRPAMGRPLRCSRMDEQPSPGNRLRTYHFNRAGCGFARGHVRPDRRTFYGAPVWCPDVCWLVRRPVNAAAIDRDSRCLDCPEPGRMQSPDDQWFERHRRRSRPCRICDWRDPSSRRPFRAAGEPPDKSFRSAASKRPQGLCGYRPGANAESSRGSSRRGDPIPPTRLHSSTVRIIQYPRCA